MKVQGIYNNRIFKRGLEFAANNGSLFVAASCLVLSSVVRPAVIMATPHTDKENKKYASAKSIASSAAGYFMMLAASSPFARAMKNIDKNPSKYLKEQTINNLKAGSKTLSKSKRYSFATQLFKLGLGFVIAVPKSILTANLIPPVMSEIFHKKDNKQNSCQNRKNIHFGGLYQQGTEKLSKGIGKLIDTPFVQKMSNKFHNTNFEQHIISLTDVVATGTFIAQTLKNKKIEKDRKKPLIYNAAISTGLCLGSGYVISGMLNKPTEKFIREFSQINKNSPKLDKYIEGIRVLKPVLILGTIYYAIIPVISTFFADRIDKK